MPHLRAPVKAPPAVPRFIPPPAAALQPPPQPPGGLGPAPVPALENVLAFDAEQKDVSVTNGTTEAHFSFNLTNISSGAGDDQLRANFLWLHGGEIAFDSVGAGSE